MSNKKALKKHYGKVKSKKISLNKTGKIKKPVYCESVYG